MTKLCCF